MPIVEGEKKWRMWRLTSSVTHISSVPGIYVIGHDETISGLEIKRVYVYIGQTNNLKRRFVEHLPQKELNPGLRRWLRGNLHNAKIWYTTEIAKSSLLTMEQKLIQVLMPEFNIQGKKA